MKLVKTPNQIQKTAANRESGLKPIKYRRPFWLPASNYYVLALAVIIASFFLIWGLLHGGEDDAALIFAGVISSVLLTSAVVLREIVLRKARNRYLLAQKQLDYNLNSAALHARANQNANKLTLEKNAAIIKEIEKKSEATRVLGRLPEGHLEVFEMCSEYLEINEKELITVGVGSPRLAALRRGKEIVKELHHFHLLQWAETESRALTQGAKNRVTITEKLETAQKALSVLESALEFYPVEKKLIESGNVLREFIASIKVSHWIEQAERSAFKGNYKRAISHYRDALFFLARGNIQREEKEFIADKINSEINKLREISENKGKNITNLEN